MAASMANTCAKESATKIVSVVGMAHLSGIEKNLVDKYGYQIVKNLCGEISMGTLVPAV